MSLYIKIPDDKICCPCTIANNTQCRIAPIICDGKLASRPSVCPIKEVREENHFPCSASIDLIMQAISCLRKVIDDEK